MSSSIQFRFSSSKTYEAVTFSGLMIKLLELKRAIVEKRNLDKGTSDFDLRISNAQTDEVYESDDVMVPKNTSVVVRRVPCTAETGLLAKLEGGARISTRAARAIEVQARPQKVETAAEGDLDLRGFLGVDESVRKGFQVIRGTVTLTTNADEATVAKLKGAVDSHCPMCATISEKIPIALTVVKA